MILQSLVHYYESLLAQGLLTKPGWINEKVTWALEITPQGEVAAVHDLRLSHTNGKRSVLLPRSMSVPERVKRSSGIAVNFLCDNSSYILGVDNKGKPQRSLQCFQACREFHLMLLQDVPGPAAEAICAFFTNWNPANIASVPAFSSCLEEIQNSGNIVFLLENGHFAADDPDIQHAWQKHCSQANDAPSEFCLVTGQQDTIARLHPSIKGVTGAQSSGASLVSFNSDSFCSYGHDQGENAPVGNYAAFAYTQALNYLLADYEHVQHIGDTTVVCWAESGSSLYQDIGMAALFADNRFDENQLRDMVARLAQGKAANWQDATLDPGEHFYILGLSPNAARLSVRFFWQDTFGKLAQNAQLHFEQLNIARSASDKFQTIPLYFLLQETVNKKASNPAPPPQLAGEVIRAILNGTPYPTLLLNNGFLRIRAERDVTRGRAAIIKAYYLRREHPLCPKEVLTVELNKDCNYQPYLLGRFFAVLEAVQQTANPNLTTTITDRYFNSAASTPAVVFPTLVKLAQKHLQKLNAAQKVYYNKQITDLLGRCQQDFPSRMTTAEQGAFILGYYHQTQDRFTKKEER